MSEFVFFSISRVIVLCSLPSRSLILLNIPHCSFTQVLSSPHCEPARWSDVWPNGQPSSTQSTTRHPLSTVQNPQVTVNNHQFEISSHDRQFSIVFTTIFLSTIKSQQFTIHNPKCLTNNLQTTIRKPHNLESTIFNRFHPRFP